MKQSICTKIWKASAPWQHGTIPKDEISDKQRTKQEEIEKCLNCEKRRCDNCFEKKWYVKKSK